MSFDVTRLILDKVKSGPLELKLDTKLDKSRLNSDGNFEIKIPKIDADFAVWEFFMLNFTDTEAGVMRFSSRSSSSFAPHYKGSGSIEMDINVSTRFVQPLDPGEKNSFLTGQNYSITISHDKFVFEFKDRNEFRRIIYLKRLDQVNL